MGEIVDVSTFAHCEFAKVLTSTISPKIVDVSTFANSQCAIREYMHFKLENEYMHEARVLVSSMGKTRYNDILKVVPRIETNNSSIDIIGDAQFELDYYGKYTNEYQIFTLINGTLLIKGVDRWGNPIEIDITSV